MCCWVFLKGFSMTFWDFTKKKWWSDFFFHLIGFSKNLKISDFRKIWFSKISHLDFSKIWDFRIFRKSDQLEKKIPTINFFFWIKSKNFIERPFRNTQQRILTPRYTLIYIFIYEKNQKMYVSVGLKITIFIYQDFRF